MRVLVFLLLCVLAGPASSQSVRIDALSLQSGARARILGPTVASTSPDSLRYSMDGGLNTRSVAWQQISKMDASMGRHTNVGRGAGIGFLVGAIGGAAFGAATASGVDGRNRGPMAALVGLPMGALGGFMGAVLGLAGRTEDWVPVTLPRTPVASNQRSINDTSP